MTMDHKVREAVEKLTDVVMVVMVVSCLELPNKGLGEKKDVAGVSCRKDESGTVKVTNDRKKIWKEHMEKLMNIENELSDSIDASKVEGVVREIEVEECNESYENWESTWVFWGCYRIV